MSLLHIRAACACDDCGSRFEVSMDPAQRTQWEGGGFASLHDVFLDALSGGVEHSHYDGIMRCDACTSKYTREWIAANPNKISGIRPDADGWTVTTYADVAHYIPKSHPAGEPQFDAEIAPWLTTLEA